MTSGCVMIVTQGPLYKFKVSGRKSKFVSALYLSYGEAFKVPTSLKIAYGLSVCHDYLCKFKVTVKRCIISVYAIY